VYSRHEAEGEDQERHQGEGQPVVARCIEHEPGQNRADHEEIAVRDVNDGKKPEEDRHPQGDHMR